MKILLTLCLAAVGLVGFASTKAEASEATLASMPKVVHIDQVLVVETGHRRHHHYYHHPYHHRRYYYRHHRRYYY